MQFAALAMVMLVIPHLVLLVQPVSSGVNGLIQVFNTIQYLRLRPVHDPDHREPLGPGPAPTAAKDRSNYSN